MTKPGYAAALVREGGILDSPEYVYLGDDLGATYCSQATTFKLWAPTALKVSVLLYDGPAGGQPQRIAMERQEKGVWAARVNGDLKGRYYVYEILHSTGSVTVPDPYSRAAAANSARTLIFDPADADPADWDQDVKPPFAHPVDAIIYEMHVRDMTIDPSSGVAAAYRGKYLGLAQEGTRGPDGVTTALDHLRDLGITHVHLLPVFDFASADETNPHSRNWGYDPVLYNTPEGSYATDPDGVARIREFKQMVLALHRAGIRVVTDMVYNHTSAWGSASQFSIFDKVVPGYYYRFDSAGNYAGASGCGNEVASERPMVRKFILDSVKYWAREYHLDGMRFDLMALIDKDTMVQVEKELRQIDPAFLIYGEPWTVGTSPLPPEQQITKGHQKGLHIAVFNDHFRDALKGPWDDDHQGGFINGAAGKEEAVALGVAGAVHDFTASPEETIQYVTCHDGMTLWDRVRTSNPENTPDEQVRMDLLGNAIVLTSQGIPFIQAGEEFLRTKGFNANSFNAGDQVNAIDWSLKAKNAAVFRYYQGLIALRKQHPSFRLRTAAEIEKSLKVLRAADHVVAYKLQNGGDPWSDIVVIYNGGATAQTVSLPEGGWVAVVGGEEAGVTPITQMANYYVGQATVPAFSAMVLYKGLFPAGFVKQAAQN